MQLREQEGARHAGMSRTTIARAYEVVAFADAYGKNTSAAKLAEMYTSKGALNELSEEVSVKFVDAALYVKKRALSVPNVRKALLDIESKHGVKTPFQSIYTMRALCEKAERQEYVEWAIDSLMHEVMIGQPLLSDINTRNILGKVAGANNRGLIDSTNLKRAFALLIASNYSVKFDMDTRNLISTMTTSHSEYYKLFGHPEDKKAKNIAFMSTLKESGQMLVRFVEA